MAAIGRWRRRPQRSFSASVERIVAALEGRRDRDDSSPDLGFGGTLLEPPPGGQDLVPLDTYPELHLRAGASAVVAEMARRGYRQAILSNTAVSDEGSVRRLLARLNVVQFFSVVVATRSELDPTRAGKPDREVFVRVLAELGLEPKAAAMIGNSWQHDVLGALNAGLQAFWITNPEVCNRSGMGGDESREGWSQVVKIHDLPDVGPALEAIAHRGTIF